MKPANRKKTIFLGIILLALGLFKFQLVFTGDMIIRKHVLDTNQLGQNDHLSALYLLSPILPGAFGKGERITPVGINATGVHKVIDGKLMFTCSGNLGKPSREGICQIDIDGQNFELLAAADDLNISIWDVLDIFPDGRLLYVERNQEDDSSVLYRIDLNGGVQEYLAVLPFDVKRGFEPPLISPDGKWIAFVDVAQWEIKILDIGSGELTVIGDGANVVWSADSQNIGYIRTDDDDFRNKDFVVFSLSKMEIVREVAIKEYLCARGNLTGNSDLTQIYFEVACGESDKINGLTYLNGKTGRVKFDIVWNPPYDYYPTDPYWFP